MSDFTYNNFIQFTNDGIVKADYKEIVDGLMLMMKQIYGNDIDLDVRSADGRLIYNAATILNNAYQCLVQNYSSLDPSTAGGKYLDILCSLTNVQRKSATHSLAKVNVKNNSTSITKVYTTSAPLTLLDDSGNLWTCTTTELSIQPKTNVDLNFQCEETGRITTSDLRLVELDGDISLSLLCVNLGEDKESDSDLRNRRALASTQSVSVVEGLQGALSLINGVEDCYVYSNNTISTITSDSGVSIPRCACYIICRYNKVLDDNNLDALVGKMIARYITLGVLTVGGNRTYTTNDKTFYKQTYNWQVATAVKPTITITLHLLNNFAGTSTCEIVAKQLVKYLENRLINEFVAPYKIVSAISNSDPLYQSRPTFYLTTDDISGLGDKESNKANKDTYFDYGNYTITYTTQGTDTWAFQIIGE